MQQIRLAVRQLVEFLLQTGDIDSRFAGFDRANEGARIHRRLQKQAGGGLPARGVPVGQPGGGRHPLHSGRPR